MQYCSLQHRTLLLSPVTSTVLFLLWLHSFILSAVISPLISSSMLGTCQPGEFSVQCPIFLPFHTFMGFSRQEYWSDLPFSSPADHFLSEHSTTICPSWVALHSKAHSFIKLDKSVVHVIRLVGFLWLWFLLAQQLSNMQYSIINGSHYAVYYLPITYLLCNC